MAFSAAGPLPARDSWCFHSVAPLPVSGLSAGRGRHEGKTVVDFYEVKEKENQLPVIRMSQVSARKRKERMKRKMRWENDEMGIDGLE